MKIKCNKCGHIGEESEFPKGNDFFQNTYIASCPKCDNRQSPGNASMRGFGGRRPFEFADAKPPSANVVEEVIKRMNEAS